jgi:hypothetical protein
MKIIKNTGGTVSHGYPLGTGDLDGDKKQEVIYGGFTFRGEATFADVRVFKLRNGKLFKREKLFRDLKIPFRVNALSVTDLDGDSCDDVVIAGRTLRGKKEYPVFAWQTRKSMGHRVFPQTVAGRLRTLAVGDLDYDGKGEIITGGRLDVKGDFWLADLSAWRINYQSNRAARIWCTQWSYGRLIRLRSLSIMKSGNKHAIFAGGRFQTITARTKNDWKAYVRIFSAGSDSILPSGDALTFSFGQDTRIRYIELLGNRKLAVCGFTRSKGKKESGFVRILKMK